MSQDVRTDQKSEAPARRIWSSLNFRRNEFRTLQLHEVRHEDGGQVIHASVHNEPANGHRPYTALSYAWGTLTASKRMILNGEAHLITENLHQALLVLFAQGVINLWVDALCIDQDNPDEKGAQVQRMATIFQKADCVVIWLGSSSARSQEILRFLEGVESTALDQYFWGQSLLNPLWHGNLDFDESFKEFLGRDYWQRTWCIQEIATAQKIMLFCGTDCIDGTALEALFSRTMWESQRPGAHSTWSVSSSSPFEDVVSLWTVRESFRSRQPMDLLTLLYDFRRGKTSLPVDRVYALLGLAFDQRSFIAESDYNLTPDQLCVDMTKRFVKLTGSLDITLLGKFRRVQSTAASWCCPFLDFDKFDFEPEFPLLIKYINGKMNDLRCGDLGAFWKSTNLSIANSKNILWEGAILKTIGLPLGVITSVENKFGTLDFGSVLTNETDPQVLRMLNSVYRLLMIHSHLYNDGDRVRKVVLYLFKQVTLYKKLESSTSPPEIASSQDLASGHESPDQNSVERPYRNIYNLFSSDGSNIFLEKSAAEYIQGLLTGSKDDADDQPPLRPTAEIIEHAMKAILEFNDKMPDCFVTDAGAIGYLGLVFSPILKAEVWLLSGCSMPLVLTRNESKALTDQPSYTIETTAIVDSVKIHDECCRVMDGEAWRTAKKEDFKWINII